MSNINSPSYKQRNPYKQLQQPIVKDLNEKYFETFFEKIKIEGEELKASSLITDSFNIEHIKEYNLSKLDLQLILLLAIYTSKRDTVKNLLNLNVDPDCRLSRLIIEEEEYPAQFLVKLKSPSNIHLEILELLLKHGCSINFIITNIQNEIESVNLLELAFNNKNYDMCKCILRYDPFANFILAVSKKKFELPLLDQFIKIGNLDLLREAAKHIHTSDMKDLNLVFFYAVINEKKEEVKVFLKQGLDLKNVKNSIKKERYKFDFFKIDVDTDEELKDFEKKLNELEKEVQSEF